MVDTTKKTEGFIIQLWYFLLHLRWHYQLFILSGGFLLGGLLSEDLNSRWFIIQFLNVHLLLFGGATAYNSYWDKDEGAVGGLKNPPEMVPWMWAASLLLQLVGLLVAISSGRLYVGIYAVSILLFWLYSKPRARWKAHPLKSLFAIGISTGFNSVLLGYLAAGNDTIPISLWIAALGVTLILLSLYPISQIYQRDEDARRGDQTFALKYGVEVVFHFFEIMFLAGLIFVSIAILYHHRVLGIFFGVIGLVIGMVVRTNLKGLTTNNEEYDRVMRIKYGTSMAFVVFLLIFLILKHTRAAGIYSVIELLLK